MWMATNQGYANLDHIVGAQEISDGEGGWVVWLYPVANTAGIEHFQLPALYPDAGSAVAAIWEILDATTVEARFN